MITRYFTIESARDEWDAVLSLIEHHIEDAKLHSMTDNYKGGTWLTFHIRGETEWALDNVWKKVRRLSRGKPRFSIDRMPRRHRVSFRA